MKFTHAHGIGQHGSVGVQEERDGILLLGVRAPEKAVKPFEIYGHGLFYHGRTVPYAKSPRCMPRT